MYKARKGKGAFCNDEIIKVSDVEGELAKKNTLRLVSVLRRSPQMCFNPNNNKLVAGPRP